MSQLFRVLAAMLTFVVSFYCSLWICAAIFPRSVGWIASVVSVISAAGFARYIWKKLSVCPPGLLSTVLVSAGVVGSIGFCAGFFGPMIFTPQANQGPLLGLFFTGPLGVLVGGVGGVIWGLCRAKNMKEGSQPPS